MTARQVAAKRKTGRAPSARAWQRMLSGRRLDLLEPSWSDIEIEDIAHGLARVARWNGQTHGPHAFSVAQHCVLVEEIAGLLEPGLAPCWRLVALLHDAPEYVIGDMISPFKAALGIDYRQFEDKLQAAIHIRFRLPPEPPGEIARLVKQADRICAYFEATQLAGFSEAEAAGFFGRPPTAVGFTLEPLAPSEAQRLYLARFAALIDQE